MIMLHASYAGIKLIHFKPGMDVYDYFHNKWYENVSSVNLDDMPFGSTRYLFYGQKAEIEKMNLPDWSLD